MENKHIAVQSRTKEWDEQLKQKAKNLGYEISNPDQKTGKFLDFITTQTQKICGYDMIASDQDRNAWTTLTTENQDEIMERLNESKNKK